MNSPASIVSLSLIGLRSAALALQLTGTDNSKASQALYMLADLAEAGQNVDAHMAIVAQKLKDRTANAADWEDVLLRIKGDRDRLHSDT